jgi:hypothetical protein
MAEAVFVEAVRSPVGKRNGALSGVHPFDLSPRILNGLVQRVGINASVSVGVGDALQAAHADLEIRIGILTGAGGSPYARESISARSRAGRESVSPRPCGVSRVVQQLPQKLALELVYTGEPLPPADALKWDLINKVVPDGTVVDAPLELAERIAIDAPVSRLGQHAGGLRRR